MRQVAGRDTSSLLRLGVPLLVVAGTMLLLPVRDLRVVTGASGQSIGAIGPVPAVLELAGGLGLLLAGSITWLLGLRARIGLLTVLAGIAWFGPGLFDQQRADPSVQAVGRFILGPALLPIVAHLVFAALGLDTRRSVRVMLAGLYLLAGFVAIGGTLTYEAFYDIHCRVCTWKNPLLVTSGFRIPRAGQLGRAVLAASSGFGILVASLVALRQPGGRHGPRMAIALVGLATAAAAFLWAALLVTVPREDAASLAWLVAWCVLLASVLALAAGVMWLAMESWRRAARVREVAASLEAAPAPGTLEVALVGALEDPTLRVAYRLDEGERYVDAQGMPIATTAAPGASPTPIERDGQRLAVVWHGQGVDGDALGEAFGPAMLVALDNERLRAARLAQLADLRASRARIVAVGDAERQRLERDLHDGAQQQLLAILFDLRLARLAAARAGDSDAADELALAESETQETIDELRRIAHGIHVAVLSRSGLVPALASFTEEAPIPVTIDSSVEDRLPGTVEVAGYTVVVESVASAAGRGASAVQVEVRRSRDLLTLAIEDDAPVAPGEVAPRIADRVGAAGGTVTAEALRTGGTLLRVELPCA